MDSAIDVETFGPIHALADRCKGATASRKHKQGRKRIQEPKPYLKPGRAAWGFLEAQEA